MGKSNNSKRKHRKTPLEEWSEIKACENNKCECKLDD